MQCQFTILAIFYKNILIQLFFINIILIYLKRMIILAIKYSYTYRLYFSMAISIYIFLIYIKE